MERISVIIPMYNSEEYIRQCIESVTRQTYRHLEILVINDGSTDRGMEICKMLQRRDDRIRLINQKNQGVSSARNRGMDAAVGKYVFFLDSDDAIHPRLLEELVGKAEKYGAKLAACDVLKLKSRRMDHRKGQIAGRGRWQISKNGAESEEWFHIKYSLNLTLIGGKLIRRDSIGALRFDEDLTRGEDTLFLYELVRKRIRIAFLERKWYYYRIHAGSVTHSYQSMVGNQFYEVSRRIRDREYGRQNICFAMYWEENLILQIVQNYSILRSRKEKEECGRLRKVAASEREHPLFSKLDKNTKLLFYCRFDNDLFYPFVHKYVSVSRLLKAVYNKMRFGAVREGSNSVGIITFHCADNYGAMLQAYGLKKYVSDAGAQARIIRYEPPFMTGRHWWFPYIPVGGMTCRVGLSIRGWKAHLEIGMDFFLLKEKMKRFRKKYLIEKGDRKLLFSWQLRRLSFPYYIVGSDQIWNPDITIGLRRIYFGAFPNKYKKKVISYGASLGRETLSSQYEKRFSELIQSVDVVSIREADAVPYVQGFCRGKVENVLDPVFLLDRECWERIARRPGRRNYILIYQAEQNQELTRYVHKLAADTGLPVVELQTGTVRTANGFLQDYAVGPAEFLGYIRQAAYVVTNSFHVAAFSILFEKKFLAFPYSKSGLRVGNVLKMSGLENRLYEKGKHKQIEEAVDWDEVNRKMREHIRRSKAFLKDNLPIL